ncbi:MAG: HipA domain-containing protein [Deltaproteobacteria bacterium]|jgi:hypothetical protein|nr:HipA domain-containing protein [Deltaproteobacteria bacterium]
MDYELMHREIPAAVLELSVRDGRTYVDKVEHIGDIAHMPIGTVHPNSAKCKPKRIEDWLKERAIPYYRPGLKTAIDELGLPRPNVLLLDSLGLSLSDQYWLRPNGSGISWSDANFFRNGFSEDLGDILLGILDTVGNRSLVSPDASLTGYLPKKWTVREGKRILMKGGQFPYFQEPENEAIASRAMEALGVHHVDYELAIERDEPYSLCETFVDDGTDFVSAYYIMDMCLDMPKDESKSYDFFLGWCVKRGIADARAAMDRLIVADFLLRNTDRHFNNFGVLRDAETLAWKGFSPVFDTGNCLWNQEPTASIWPEDGGECRPFRSDFEKQLLLVSDFSWVDPRRLTALPGEIAEMFRANGLLPPERVGKIHECLARRANFLEGVVADPETLRKAIRHRRSPGYRR